MTSLFVPGDFWSHSGRRLPFKVECDVLTERDLDLFGELIATRLYAGWEFGHVVGVPKGQPGGRDNGGVLAQYVKRHLTLHDADQLIRPVLIVDDVLTTGKSMEETRARKADRECIGAVIFARGPCPAWVKPLFTLNEKCW